jgi:hypothetical protein
MNELPKEAEDLFTNSNIKKADWFVTSAVDDIYNLEDSE